jgi:hypothetical protein
MILTFIIFGIVIGFGICLYLCDAVAKALIDAVEGNGENNG